MSNLEKLNDEVLTWVTDLTKAGKPPIEVLKKGEDLKKRILESYEEARKDPAGAGLSAIDTELEQKADMIREKIWELIYQGKISAENLQNIGLESFQEYVPSKGDSAKLQAVKASACAVCAVCTVCASCAACLACIITGIAATGVTAAISTTQSTVAINQ